MIEHTELTLIRELAPLLGFALIFVLLFRKLGLGATLGFLVAGALVGPQVLGLVGDVDPGVASVAGALTPVVGSTATAPRRTHHPK